MSDWKSEFELELERAAHARSSGKEGRARVCARRAAGIAVREYLRRQGKDFHTTSAYDLLNVLVKDPNLPDECRRSASHLTLTVNEEFKLPAGVDLLVEARTLCYELLSEPGKSGLLTG